MSRDEKNNANILQQEIRKQFGSSATARFVRSLPVFYVERSTPERFSRLLAELDRAEGEMSGGK